MGHLGVRALLAQMRLVDDEAVALVSFADIGTVRHIAVRRRDDHIGGPVVASRRAVLLADAQARRKLLQLVEPLADERVVDQDDRLALVPRCQNQRGTDHRLAHAHLVRQPAAAHMAAKGHPALGVCAFLALTKRHVLGLLDVDHEGERLALVRTQGVPSRKAGGLGALLRVDLLDALDQLLHRPARLACSGVGVARATERQAGRAGARGSRRRVLRAVLPLLASEAPLRVGVRGLAVLGPLGARLGHIVAHVAVAVWACVHLGAQLPRTLDAVLAGVRKVAERDAARAPRELDLVVLVAAPVGGGLGRGRRLLLLDLHALVVVRVGGRHLWL